MKPANESDPERKTRQRREVDAYEKAHDYVPGSAGHRGDGPHGGPDGGITWEGVARSAHARLSAGRPLNDRDREAIRRYPTRPPMQIPAHLHGQQIDYPETPAAPAAEPPPPAQVLAIDHDHDREVEMYGQCITCSRSDGAAGQLRAQQSIEQADEHADPQWKVAARSAILAMEPDTEFTTDDVWARLQRVDASTHEKRAMGGVMLALAREGELVALDQHQPSTRPEAHANPKRVWRRARI